MKRILVDPRFDAFLGVAFGVGSMIDVLVSGRASGPLWLNLVCSGALGVAVALRRRRTLTGCATFVAACCALSLWGTVPSEMVLPFFGLLLMPYAAGARVDGLLGYLVVPVFVAMVALVAASEDTLVVSDLLFPAVLVSAAWFAGRTVHSRIRLTAELHEAAVRAEDARRAEAVEAVAAERRRIAREMHDIVAHSISVMVVQAGGARRIMDRDIDRAIDAAVQIERTGRDALFEMRRLLGVLGDAGEPASRAPQPGLDGLPALIRRARDAGLPVTLIEEGERCGVPTGLDVTAYRLVQEALTNCVKYAGGARTEVMLRWTPKMLELSVVDRGAGRPADHNLAPGGHGLIGMQERVRLYGGELFTGRRRSGGFEVRARLPLQPEEALA